MAYQIPPARTVKGQDKFEFGPKTGSEFSVRSVQLHSVGELEELEKGNNALEFFSGMTAAQKQYVRSLKTPQFKGLYQAWLENEGMTAGE